MQIVCIILGFVACVPHVCDLCCLRHALCGHVLDHGLVHPDLDLLLILILISILAHTFRCWRTSSASCVLCCCLELMLVTFVFVFFAFVRPRRSETREVDLRSGWSTILSSDGGAVLPPVDSTLVRGVLRGRSTKLSLREPSGACCPRLGGERGTVHCGPEACGSSDMCTTSPEGRLPCRA